MRLCEKKIDLHTYDMKEETEARFQTSLKHLNDINKDTNKDEMMTNEELEECCRFVYVTKDKLKSFIKE